MVGEVFLLALRAFLGDRGVKRRGPGDPGPVTTIPGGQLVTPDGSRDRGIPLARLTEKQGKITHNPVEILQRGKQIVGSTPTQTIPAPTNPTYQQGNNTQLLPRKK